MRPALTKAGRFRGPQAGAGSRHHRGAQPGPFPPIVSLPLGKHIPLHTWAGTGADATAAAARDRGCAAEGISELELLQHSSEESFGAQVPRQVVCKLFP